MTNSFLYKKKKYTLNSFKILVEFVTSTWVVQTWQDCNKKRAGPHLLAVDPLQVEVVEAVDDEGAPQSQTDHWIALWVDGQLVQTPHLSQGRQLGQTADVGFQEDHVLQKREQGSEEMGRWVKAKVGDKQGVFVSQSAGIHQPTASKSTLFM